MAQKISTSEALEILLRANKFDAVEVPLEDYELDKADPRGLLTPEEVASRKSVIERSGFGGPLKAFRDELWDLLEAEIKEADAVVELMAKYDAELAAVKTVVDWAFHDEDSDDEGIAGEIIEIIKQVSLRAESSNMTLWRRLMSRYFPAYVQDQFDFDQLVLNLAQNQSELGRTEVIMISTMTKVLLGIPYEDLMSLGQQTRARRVRMLKIAGVPTRFDRVDYDAIGAVQSSRYSIPRSLLRGHNGVKPLIFDILGNRRPTVVESRALDVLRGVMSDRAIAMVFKTFERMKKDGVFDVPIATNPENRSRPPA